MFCFLSLPHAYKVCPCVPLSGSPLACALTTLLSGYASIHTNSLVNFSPPTLVLMNKIDPETSWSRLLNIVFGFEKRVL